MSATVSTQICLTLSSAIKLGPDGSKPEGCEMRPILAKDFEEQMKLERRRIPRLEKLILGESYFETVGFSVLPGVVLELVLRFDANQRQCHIV